MRPFFTSPRSPRSRHAVLAVQPLEGRLVPAGTVTAALSPLGVLTITGDDDDNGVTLKVTGTDVTITPDAGTSINAADAGDAVTITGVVKSIRANFLGGSDTVAIDGASPFLVAGPVVLSLGDGNNVLDLTTAEKIQLGALTVRGGDGTDTVTVDGGDGMGSQVVGGALFSYLGGGSTTTLQDMRFGVGVRVVAGDAVSVPNEVNATNVVVVRTLSAALGNSNPALVTVTDSQLGGLVETGYTIGALLTNTQVTGNVAVRAGFQGDLQVDGTTVNGSVTVVGPLASMSTFGTGSTINGNLVLSASSWTNAAFLSDTLSEVRGNVTVVGGWYSDQFVTNGQFRVGKSATFTLKGGDNLVAIGDGTAQVSIGANLTVRGGAGADTVALDRVNLTGAALLLTYAGADTVFADGGTTFGTSFTADAGTGDDLISVAQNTGSAAAVTFNGPAKILGGAGNDTLLLGLDDTLFGGDGNSRAVFFGLTNLVDGGLGVDSFDDATGQYVGVTPIGWNP